MKPSSALTILFIAAASTCSISTPSRAADSGWSVVAHAGSSTIDDQSPIIANSPGLTDGPAQVTLDAGFTAGLGVRYDYENSPWVSELGWEYRSNDAQTSTADSTLPGGNYASNIFYINARYQIKTGHAISPWLGAGITWEQEIDLDSEGADGELSFSDGGSTGVQFLLGADYDLSDRIYLSGEIRYANTSGISLSQEDGAGEIRNLDYQPLTLAIGLGYRF